jgi:type III secretion system YscQ/HrcQ family protein
VAAFGAIRAASAVASLSHALEWLTAPLGASLVIGPMEVLPRVSGLKRPGAIAQIVCPARGTRLGLGLETSLAHALVDRSLGHVRGPGADRLQITPVEFGVLTYMAARVLAELRRHGGPDLLLDRLGPVPMAVDGLGPMLTLRWIVRVADDDATAAARLWVPWSFLDELTGPSRSPSSIAPTCLSPTLAGLTSDWRAVAGTATLARGGVGLRPGLVLPIDDAPLKGAPANPFGTVRVVADGHPFRSWFDSAPVPRSGAGRLVLSSSLQCETIPRGPLAMTGDPSSVRPGGDPPSPVTAASPDLPVTLAVELGRLTLSVSRVAALAPGDVIALERHAREPVELTSGGRLVARGELVQIDQELGVRITRVFL